MKPKAKPKGVCPGCGEKLPDGYAKCGACILIMLKADREAKYQNPTLNERESTHGDYTNTARCACLLKAIFRDTTIEAGKEIDPKNDTTCRALESIDLICTKLARLASGDMLSADTWKDIAGYANLVSERLEREK